MFRDLKLMANGTRSLMVWLDGLLNLWMSYLQKRCQGLCKNNQERWSRKEIEEARFNDMSLNYSYSHFDESEKLKINKSNSKKESLLQKLKNLFSFLGFIKRD